LAARDHDRTRAAPEAARGLGGSRRRSASSRELSRSELLRALNERQFRAHLQPQLDLRTRRVTGVEALARWERPGQGLCPPALFLGEIEAGGLMLKLTEVILDDALGWLARRRDAGEAALSVAVNVSAAAFDARLVSQLDGALRRWRVPPSQVTVEITETAVMRDASRTVEILGRLKSLGLQLSIDDFGTGYSSLARLQRLPIDEIKIDRSFIGELRDGGDRGMVRAIADLGRNFGLRVLAEGVEHEAELTRLAALGCDLAQGFVISPPVCTSALDSWLEQHRPEPAPAASQLPSAARRAPKQSSSVARSRRLPSYAQQARPPGTDLGARLHEIVQEVIATDGPEPMLERLLSGLAQELRARLAGCWVFDVISQQLEPAGTWSLPGDSALAEVREALSALRFAPGMGLPGLVLAQDRMLCSDDLTETNSLLAFEAGRVGCSSVLVFPLRSNREVVGVLEFLAAGPMGLDEQLEPVLRQVGSIVGEFLAARRAENDARTAAEVLATISQAAAELGSEPPEGIADRLCAHALRVTGADTVLLWQPTSDGSSLTVTGCAGLELGVLSVSLTQEHSGAAAAFHSGRSHFVGDVANHGLPSKRLASAVRAAAALYHPVSRSGRRIGVLAIAWRHRLNRLEPTQRLAVEVLAAGAAPHLPASVPPGGGRTQSPRPASVAPAGGARAQSPRPASVAPAGGARAQSPRPASVAPAGGARTESPS
jgi:EAL domain-containing protein (putative c-di-GMP-specific phosphodiesterase class I)